MTSSFDADNAAGSAGEKIGEAFEGAADKWRALSGRTKKIIAGGTAAATLSGVTGGLLLTGHEEELSPESVQSGQLIYDAGTQPMRDASGKAALMNYFEEGTPAEEQVLRVSIATQLPQAFRNGNEQGDYLDTVENTARSHTTEIYYVPVCNTDSNNNTTCRSEMRTRTDYHYYRYDLDIEDDFVPAKSEQVQQVRAYFDEFEKLTGIRVEVSENDQDAHITVANYRNAPGWYRGSLDYVRPAEIATFPEGANSRQGPSLKRNLVIMNDRNRGDANNIMDAIGKPLGFENGQVNIVTLRAELARLGFDVSPLAAQDNEYTLDNGVQVSRLMPENVIIDNGGNDTLIGSDKNDTLVAEAGMCGATNTPRNKFTNIFGNGKQYCLAEGEFEVVRAGAGDDLIIAARGGGQTIEPGAGADRIAYFQPDIGDTTILAASGTEGNNTLYLHDANVYRGNIDVRGNGDDIVLDFSAFSGREVGSISLPDQLSGGGISNLVVVDSKGNTVFEKDVSGLDSAEAWQNEVVKPMDRAVDKKMQGEAQEEAARWRNNVRRRRDEEPDLEGPSY